MPDSDQTSQASPAQPPSPEQPQVSVRDLHLSPGESQDCGRPASQQTSVSVAGQTSHITVNTSQSSVPALQCQVALTYKLSSRPFCGGSLLTSTTVITAAHCQTLILLFRVVLAEHDVTAADGEVVLPPLLWVSHPQYDQR